ncbi:MAG TPA: hypothetical protein EYH31_11595, partial [Anaerolineae bacterium]|nr:hypothetical protein [Anaerolineae bacterium]
MLKQRALMIWLAGLILVGLALGLGLAVSSAQAQGPTPVSCVDVDGNGWVMAGDIVATADRWEGIYDLLYDLDGDGDIDIADVQRVATMWGQHCITLALLPAQQTVPVSSGAFTLTVWVSNTLGLR